MKASWALSLGALGCLSQGAPTFAPLFRGGAVLQRGTGVAIWGSGAHAGGVSLFLDGERVAVATVASDGAWSARLPARNASFASNLLAKDAEGSGNVTVAFGDVLLCSGQSNMDMPVVNRKVGGFQADNGTAEAAAATRYTGGISLWKQVQSKYSNPAAWNAVSPKALTDGFSALCWYIGKSHFERLGGAVPVGLLQASVGGSPIEYWLSAESLAKCEVDKPACDTQLPDSSFHDDQIVSLQPYTVGAIVWDQSERDLKCNHIKAYACMQRELARSWRREFASLDVPFVAVQLPDYFDAKDPGAPGVLGYGSVAEGVFEMRLAQETGLEGADPAAIVATYDQSCNDLAYPENCPFGSVHNVHKQEIGSRVAAQLARLMRGEALVTEGPRAQAASAESVGNSTGFSVTVRFKGGSMPFALLPARNCTQCCQGSFGTVAKGDFDVSHDGATWVLGSGVRMSGEDGVVFHAELPHTKPPTVVRYTAGSNFTQCALYNAEALPAMPFRIEVSSAAGVDVNVI
eukprot:TRINITY_DN63234_c0_g1_i1.p1 TRINITY_DN63234_c0_g1~~TRINITY_DN63234_c0_g1_i1.p1  ORF type:complete len:518 (-),score=104.51 TRINITY_DN63234_c0_g1_i1:233-1786(-)